MNNSDIFPTVGFIGEIRSMKLMAGKTANADNFSSREAVARGELSEPLVVCQCGKSPGRLLRYSEHAELFSANPSVSPLQGLFILVI
jgi:hypothetical protein